MKYKYVFCNKLLLVYLTHQFLYEWKKGLQFIATCTHIYIYTTVRTRTAALAHTLGGF